MGIKGLIRLLACAVLLSASTAGAAELHGRSSTQLLWYNDFVTGDEVTGLGQYLQLSVTKVDPAGRLSFQGYGRLSQDFGNGEGLNGRLYYLYGDYRNIYSLVDLRFGRQFVNYAAGSALVDGGRIDLKNVGPVAFSVMGGRNVFFGLDGEATDSNDFVWGVAANLADLKSTDAEISYFMKLDDAGIARDQVGATFKQYLLNSLKIYGNTRFDLAHETFSEVLAGLKYFPSSELVLTGEWYQSYPMFDNSSIYTVFSVDRYQEWLFRVDYTLSAMIGMNAGYNWQDYGEGEDADVFQVGARIRPLEALLVNLGYDFRNGFGGKLNGGAAEVVYTPVKPLELAAGIHYDTYERDRSTGRETARRYWGGAKYRLSQSMTASVRIEDNVSHRFESDWSGRAVFNYDF